MNIEPHGDKFPTTGWTLIRMVQDPMHPEYQQAREHFARLYCRPVFCFLVAVGRGAAEAEDWAQEFWLWLLAGNKIQKADQGRGSFRTFLRMNLRSFVADQASPQRQSLKKRFERRMVSLDGLVGDGDRSYEPAAGETPEQIFDREFARSLIGKVRKALRKTCENEKRPEWYEIFAAVYPDDNSTPPQSQQALAELFGKTRDEVRGILDRMKKRCERLLRNELRDEGGTEADIEAEAAELLSLLSR